jgi:hypothetical protein
MTVREAEQIARKIALDRVRRHNADVEPELLAIEAKLKESLGTRVRIERKDVGGKITIDFFSDEDLKAIVDIVNSKNLHTKLPSAVSGAGTPEGSVTNADVSVSDAEMPLDDRSKEEIKADENDEELYSLKNFSI